MTILGLELAPLIISTFLIVLLGLLFYLFKTKKRKDLYTIIALFIVFLISRLILEFSIKSHAFYLYTEVISWMALSLAFIKIFIRAFLQDFLGKKHDINIPRIVQDLLQILAFIVIAIIILKQYFKLDTSILVTSSVLSIVIGLALQETLGNFFSGLAIQMQKPFEKGDWIIINNQIGQVKDIDWRTIRVQTLDLDYYIIPNSEISKTSFTNYSKPTKLHRVVIPIGVSYKSPPNLVKKIIMDVLTDEPEILQDPEPTILLVDYKDFSINYEVRVFTENFRRFKEIKDSIYTKLWYQFERNDIVIPFPITDVYLHEAKSNEPEKQIERLVDILSSVDFLDPLSVDDLKQLAINANIENFAENETIIRQGSPGDTFYIIETGKVEVSYIENDDKTILKNLHANSFFGEMSLLTGEERAATVTAITDCKLLSINPETFKAIIMNHPDIANKISNIISRRQFELDETIQDKSSEDIKKELDQKTETLFNRMKSFLRF